MTNKTRKKILNILGKGAMAIMISTTIMGAIV